MDFGSSDPASRLFPHSVAGIETMRARLRQLADDCEERARRSDSEVAIKLYRQAAPEARHAAVALHMGDCMRRTILARCEALATAARLYDGEGIDDWEQSEPLLPPKAAEPMRPATALSAPKLAEATGMSRRGALKVIERGHRFGLPDFHCEGRGERRRWFATRDAFDGLRGVSSQ